MRFSLFFFSGDGGSTASRRYRLVEDAARYADQRGFTAIWLPERHFNVLGGLYPNPAVLGGALALATSRIQIRAGSVILPLHDPIRVAEEWAMVDELSGGRIGISFGSGWQPHDFALQPQHFSDRRAVLRKGIEEFKALWLGGSVERRSGDGSRIDVRTFPRPAQPRLPPLWLSSTGSLDTATWAGAEGYGLLTALLYQGVEDLERNLRTYRAASSGGTAPVTLMVHSFVGESDEDAARIVRPALRGYLRTSIELTRNLASQAGLDLQDGELSEADVDDMLEFAVERYLRWHALVGGHDRCASFVERMVALGVDEIACFIDFGIDADTVLAGLERLDRLRAQFAAAGSRPPSGATEPAVRAQDDLTARRGELQRRAQGRFGQRLAAIRTRDEGRP
jgi:natural product biosynthesis luciferase-like monooxygenase protein